MVGRVARRVWRDGRSVVRALPAGASHARDQGARAFPRRAPDPVRVQGQRVPQPVRGALRARRHEPRVQVRSAGYVPRAPDRGCSGPRHRGGARARRRPRRTPLGGAHGRDGARGGRDFRLRRRGADAARGYVSGRAHEDVPARRLCSRPRARSRSAIPGAAAPKITARLRRHPSQALDAAIARRRRADSRPSPGAALSAVRRGVKRRRQRSV